MILCIETAASVCSAALCSDTGVVSVRESIDARSHATSLTLFIKELLEEQRLNASNLQAVAVSRGPGSYTGLRIGVSAAKGIAYRAGIPLIGIETTTAMFHGMKARAGDIVRENPGVLFCPMIDARRMEVYNTLLDAGGTTVRKTSASVIDENSFMDIPGERMILFFGEGSEKCRNIIKRRNCRFIDDFRASAAHLCIPSAEALKSGKFEDTAYFEPFYLKDFIATVPKKSILK